MNKKQPRILYFITCAVPSVKELEEAEKCGNNVVFRNANLVPSVCNPERCDGVAGSVPTAYKGLPTAKQVLADFKATEKAEREAQIKKLKATEAANEGKKKAMAEAAEKLKEAKEAKVEAGKKVAAAKQEAAKATVTWQAGK